MKRYLCLIFIMGCSGYQETDEWTLNYERGQSYPKDFGNPDIGARIERPCEVYDSFCIRSFLTEHSSCKKRDGPIPDPLYRSQSTLNAAYANMSVIWNNLRYSNLNNSRVEEFYINRATDNMVIAVYFDSINIAANPMYLKFYRRGQEPAIARDFAAIEFRGVSITAVIPNVDNLKLENAEIFSYIDSTVSPFLLGPGLAVPLARDPVLAAQYARFFTGISTGVREVFLTEGPFLLATYLQRGVSITAVIPNVDNLKLENAEIFSYIDSTVSPFLLGPGLAVPLARDPVLAAQYARFFTGISTGVREVFLTEGPFLLATYLQSKLCDFGLKLF